MISCLGTHLERHCNTRGAQAVDHNRWTSGPSWVAQGLTGIVRHHMCTCVFLIKLEGHPASSRKARRKIQVCLFSRNGLSCGVNLYMYGLHCTRGTRTVRRQSVSVCLHCTRGCVGSVCICMVYIVYTAVTAHNTLLTVWCRW